jgi:hypothetical protein
MKITLDIDRDQLGILLGHIEAMFFGDITRSEDGLKQQIFRAVAEWNPEGDGRDFAFDLVRIAPVYRQLLKHCDGSEPAETTFTDSADEFVTAVLAAQEGLP